MFGRKLKSVLSLTRFIKAGTAGTALFFLTQACWAGNITLTTYYPAPQGNFDRMTLMPQTADQIALPCTIGTLLVEAATGDLLYCHNVNGIGTLRPLGYTWTRTDDDIYPTDTELNPLIFVGIGTSLPSFKLTLENDGGILALGKFNQGAVTNHPILTPADFATAGGARGRLLWYPRKAAFRALLENASVMDDTQIGAYSVAFGDTNIAANIGSTASGQENSITGDYAVIAGGYSSTASQNYATITGGADNTAAGLYSTVSGYNNNASGQHNTIAGGMNNSSAGDGQSIQGGSSNSITSGATYSTISGGSSNNIIGNSDYSAIGGGASNQAIRGNYAAIGGGQTNRTYGISVFIGGGNSNNAPPGNPANQFGNYSAIGGGRSNNAANNVIGNHSAVSGGRSNVSPGLSAAVTAGYRGTASGASSLVSGGYTNTASGDYATTGGGNTNITGGDYSFAGGRLMNVTENHSFVWGNYDFANPIADNFGNRFILPQGSTGGVQVNPRLSIREPVPTAVINIKGDGTEDYFAVTSNNLAATTPGDVFIVTADGRVGIGNPNPDPNYPLHFGAQANGAHLTAGGAWVSTSSRKFKDNIQPLDPQQAVEAVRQLRPVHYNYKIAKEDHHVGFIAEEVPELIAEEGRRSIDPMSVAAILTSALKEQKKEIRKQEEILENLDKEIQNLKAAFK